MLLIAPLEHGRSTPLTSFGPTDSNES